MSTRTNLRPHSVITNGDMSANITSQVTVLQSVSGISYSLSWSGTSPLGTVSVQGSNDYSLGVDGSTMLNAGTWNNIYIIVNGGSPGPTAPISGSSGMGLIEILKTQVYAIRLIYTADDGSPGTGKLNVLINGRVS